MGRIGDFFYHLIIVILVAAVPHLEKSTGARESSIEGGEKENKK